MTKCHDCDTTNGELHELGCDMEICPLCLQQLIGCDCCYEMFYPLDQFPENGLPDDLEAIWQSYIADKRIPYKE